MISEFFIRRPVFASVLSVIIFLAGLVSIRALPIEQYPQIVPPEVSVAAAYPGADADTLATTVAAPLEQEINGVENMLYMHSTSSSSGVVTINISFKTGTDPDQAAIDVNNRVKAAEARLPEEVRRQGVRVTKQSSSILQVVSMLSPNGSKDAVFVSNYALLNVVDELKRLPGVGSVLLFGAKDYSMRIWLRPDVLAEYNMTPSEVAAAIREQNSQFAAGKFGEEPTDKDLAFVYTVTTQGRMTSVSEFENIILRADPRGATLRLKDVARVELGAQDYSFAATFNGKPSVPIGIFLQPGANALETAKSIGVKMEELSKSFPEDVAYFLPFDTTKFVKVSINEVVHTFLEAILLVVLVVYIFLQNFRATLIPLLAVPVSLIGTFTGLYMMGFSINLLTLFGMVLAIGIVVDDAIIVIENVERIMREKKLSPVDASIEAMREVTGPVIAIVLVLCAVFIPVAFMGGLTGEMYRQFAVTIVISVVISGIVALTLTPALCATMLKPIEQEHKPPYVLQKFNEAFDRATNMFVGGASFFLRHVVIGLILFVGLLAITAGLFARTPTGLVPEEDQGWSIVAYMLPPAASLSRTQAVTDVVSQRLVANPAVSSVITFAGYDILSSTNKSSGGVSFVTLKDWSERKDKSMDARALVMPFMGMGMDIKDGMTLAFNPPPIFGMSMTGGFDVFLQNRGGKTYQEMFDEANKLIAEAQKRPELGMIRTTFTTSTPQYRINLNREKARALGVPVDEVFSTMQSTFGSYYVNDFLLFGRNFKVSLQSESEFRRAPEDLRRVFVRSGSGDLIPLDSLVTFERIIGPDLIERFNAFPSAKIMGEPAKGYSSGQAIKAFEEVAAQTMDDGYTLSWSGSAFQEKLAAGTGSQAFIFGLIMVFLILAAQYERWTLPFAVVLAVPFAAFGAILATSLRGLNNDLYLQIGLVTLIGLSAKNAILIVEFAMIRLREGATVVEAAIEAARIRFRPIVMTSLAFMLGCVPLAISTGAGSASRHAIGTGVIGGMMAATFIATFFIPMFYMLLIKLMDRSKRDDKNKKGDKHV